MSAQLYQPKNVASVAIHYGATLAIAAASFALGGPIGIGIAVVLSGGISVWALKKQKDILENNLKEHPRVHPHSPHLGEIADELYKKSGLDAATHPIYDFKADRDNRNRKGGKVAAILEDVFDLMGKTHNAAALNLGKPVIMISEPLLKLLDDKEEKAVLAHEFAHAAAHHTRLGIPQSLLGGLAVATNMMTMIGAWWATGWKGILSSMAGGIAANVATSKLAHALFPSTKTYSKLPDELLGPEALAKKKQVKAVVSGVTTAVTTGILTLFNPVYLGLWAATKALGVANKLVSTAFSRSMEYQADQGAVALGADPLALAVGLRKIEQVVENSKKEAFDGKLPEKGMLSKAWHKATASHPATEDRVKRLAKMAEKQGVSQDKINAAVHGKIEVSAEHNMPYSVVKELAHGM